ncbi:MAG TPA: hypothetical protein VFP14_04050 [Novosphingobium sp.]|nr:hypothetical protein [Novosphingobium sp.]
MSVGNGRRLATVAMVAAMALLVSACLLMPGKFTSGLDLRKDGRFTYTYTGEIYLLALSKLAQEGKGNTFKPDPCYNDELKERACTAEEVAEQRKTWDADAPEREAKAKREAEQAKAMLGGIDPSDPRAAEELAARLRRQAGWRSVVYKGNGLFNVDFALTSRIDHDFAFPTLERFPMATPFIQLTRHNDGTVRIDAPGFGPGSGAGNPFAAMMQLGMSGALGGAGGDKDKSAAGLPQFDGLFVITTDGAILANNTDEGPQPDPNGQRLTWKANPRSPATPTALIRLGN